MAAIFELHATLREGSGKADSRRLRRLEDKIPSIVYGANQEPVAITLAHNKLMHALENEAFYSSILTLNIGSKQEKVVLKELHRHPSKAKILHADFLRINLKEKLNMHIPLHFLGEDVAPGVKQDGGIVSHVLNEIEVRCLPADLPEFIEVDVSELDIDSSLHLSDIKLPKDVEIMALVHDAENDQTVVSIHKPRIATVEEEVSEEAPEAEGEGEGEGEEKPE